jgi:hypothetical protein
MLELNDFAFTSLSSCIKFEVVGVSSAVFKARIAAAAWPALLG